MFKLKTEENDYGLDIKIISERVEAKTRVLTAKWYLTQNETQIYVMRHNPDKEWSRPEYPPMEEYPYKEEKC